MQNINLKQKIFMENEHARIFNAIEKKAKNYFKNYVGTKIFISDGTLLKKIKDDIKFKHIIHIENYEPLPLKNGHVSLNLYVSNGHGYNLCIAVKLCFNGGSYDDKTYYCVYIEHLVYIGKLDGNILKEIESKYNKKPMDFKQQEKQINLFKQKSKELKRIKDGINYNLNEFIKYDLVT